MGILARSELVDPELFDAARRLHLSARRVASQGRFADQRSRDRGMGLEFEDHRPYTPGDDLRAVDWHLHRRLGRLFVRLFEQQEDLPLYLMPDISRSQFLENPPRGRAGLRATVLLAAASLFQHDTVGVFPFGSDLSILSRPAAGRNRAVTLATRLAALEEGGSTNIPSSVARLSALGLRRGLVVLVSDLFDPQGIEAVTESLGRLRHKLLIVQLTRPVDANPGLAGDLRLVDCESGAVEDVSITPAVQERYGQAYGAFETHISEFCRVRGIGRIRLNCDENVVPQLAKVFHPGGFEA